LHPTGDHLFVVSETGLGSEGTGGAVHAFRIDRGYGEIDLVPLNHRPTAGDHPCHLSVDVDGRWLVVSNYGTGNVAVFPILADGSLGEMATAVQHSGSGPHVDRQEAPHAHSSIFTPDNQFLIVADLGIDRLVTYTFDGATGSLARHREVTARPGAGPRHVAFHPEGRHLFVVNELENSVTLFQRDAEAGSLRELQTVSTLPPHARENLAADIHVSASGKHVYASNRGHDSLVVYSFDPASGLNPIVVRSCGGTGPRSFGIAPGGRHLVVANRHSDEVALLPLLAGGADIGEPIARAPVSQPSCIAFV
jgi:6-phosphogluconolactonase